MDDQNSGKIIQFTTDAANTGQPQSALEKLAHQFHRPLTEELGEGLAQVLTLVDDTLFAQAEKASGNIEQTLYFDSMRDIRRQHPEIIRTFHSLLSSLFRQMYKPAIQQQPEEEPDEDNMTLLQREAYEDKVQIANIIRRLSPQCTEFYQHLQTRLQALNNDQPLPLENNPFAPETIVSAFAMAIEPLALHSIVKPDLYGLFEQLVMSRLEKIYQQMNVFLVNENILPDLRYTVRVQPTPEGHSGVAGNQQNPRSSSGMAENHGQKASLAALLQRIAQKHQQHKPLQADTSERFWSHEEILAALKGIQQQSVAGEYSPFSGNASSDDFRQHMLQVLHQQTNIHGRIPDTDDNKLDLISQLFAAIQQDSELPESFKEPICQMSLPFARVAISDSNLFTSEQHPIKELLNSMAAAAERFKGTRSFTRSLHEQYHKVIQQLSQNTQLESTEVDTHLQTLQQKLNDLDQRARKIEQRSIAAGKGLERLLEARKQATGELQQTLDQTTLPEFGQRFLETLWPSLRALQLLRPEQSQDHSPEQLIEEVLNAYHSKQAGTGKLSEHLSQLLSQTGVCTPDLTASLLQELNRDIENQNGNTSPLDNITPDRDALEIERLLESYLTPKARIEHLTENFTAGNWYRAVGTNGQDCRWKLAWCSKKRQLFLFVDGAGQKTALLNQQQLADRIQHQLISAEQSQQTTLLQRIVRDLHLKLNL